MSISTVIGIDLGSVNSRVSIWRGDNVEVLENELHERSMPSIVSFTGTKRLMGQQAREKIKTNAANTIYNMLRLVAKKYDDVSTRRTIFPYGLVDVNKKPAIQVNHKGKTKIFSPLEIIAMILAKLKKQAEEYIGDNNRIRDAVIIIPATFTNPQRQTMVDAAAVAGLRVQRFMSGPTAATLLYAFNRMNRAPLGTSINTGNMSETAHIVLVCDIGGGSLSVTLAEIDNGIVQVKATTGNTDFGGQDIDEHMVRHLVLDIRRRFRLDVSSNLKAMAKLREKCEEAKRVLSTNQSTRLEIDGLADGIELYETTFTRTDFEVICGSLLIKPLECVRKLLENANVTSWDVHEYILVGGSSKIPGIGKLLKEFFGGREPNRTVDAFEAAVRGAGVQAALCGRITSSRIQALLVLDCLPFSLGIEATGGVMEALIRSGSAIPTKNSAVYTTTEDNHTGILVKVFEGDHDRVVENTPLGVYELMGIPPAPKGQPQIRVTLATDHCGLLEVSAMDHATKATVRVEVTNKDRLSVEDIDRLKFEASTFDDEEAAEVAATGAKNELEEYAYRLKGSLDQLQSEVIRILSWLEQGANPTSKEGYEVAKLHLQENVKDLLRGTS